MTNRARRRVAVATVFLALAIPAGAASAKPGDGNGQTTPPGQAKKAEAGQSEGEGHGNRPAVPPGLAKQAEAGSRTTPPGWARAAERAASRPATLTGTVASVADGTVTVTVKGGHPLFRLWARMNGTAPDAPATIAVTLAADAVVKRDGAVVTLGELAVGDHVSIRGTFADGTVTAGRVNAASPDATDSESESESD